MFQKLSDNFFPKIDISILESFPRIHILRRPSVIEKPTWLVHYPVHKNKQCEISFCTSIHNVFPEFCEEVSSKILELSHGKIKIPVHQVFLLRTVGDVLPHRDPIRKSCINIGLNSCNAVTKFGKTNRFEDFDCDPANSNDFLCREGDIYLLDVVKVHSVCQDDITPRHLITLSFAEPYSDLINIFKP